MAWLRRFIAATPGLQQALIFTPASTSDPYLDDGPPPQLALQLYFDDIVPLEAAVAAGGVTCRGSPRRASCRHWRAQA
jgi:hypothetical protein